MHIVKHLMKIDTNNFKHWVFNEFVNGENVMIWIVSSQD